MGSVKDIEVLRKPMKTAVGKGRFIFSDRYSVFDWGSMPDHIENKGAALAMLTTYFFEKLQEYDIPTHYLGLVEDGEVKRLPQLQKPTNIVEIKLLQVIPPKFCTDENKYDYSDYANQTGCFVVPLEIIYRNFLAEGSSLLRRLKQGIIKPTEVDIENEATGKLRSPFIEPSTKFEKTDRYITWQEAKELIYLTEDEITKLKEFTNIVNKVITDEFSKIDLVNEDGKIEFGFDEQRNLMVVDAIGTLDECRFSWRGFSVSKELLRKWYRNTEWYNAIEKAKEKDSYRWKEILDQMSPPPLPPELREVVSQLYCACTNEITQKEWFKEVPPIPKLIERLKEIFNES